MKTKLLAVAALLFLPLFASAQDVETLLAPNGAFYTLKPSSQPIENNEASTYLMLSTRIADKMTTQPVPATMTAGVHSNPAMAYDAETGTLYIFWLHATGLLDSELLFASIDQSGVWSNAIAVGTTPFDYRENLRIAVTRKVIGDRDSLQPGVTVHATWWETDTHTGKESAKFAMLAIENGRVEVSNLDLGQFVTKNEKGNAAPELTENELAILRHPVMSISSKQESVLVTFGDIEGRTMHRVRVYPVKPAPPVANGRLRVPVGRGEGGVNAPRFDKASNSSMEAISGDSGLAYYVRDTDKVHYVLLRDNKWSDARAISLDEQVSASAAVDAIRRLVNDH